MQPTDKKNQRDSQLNATAKAPLENTSTIMPPSFSTEQLLHTLEVHQIQLAAQCESLMQAQIDLEESREYYPKFPS